MLGALRQRFRRQGVEGRVVPIEQRKFDYQAEADVALVRLWPGEKLPYRIKKGVLVERDQEVAA